MTKTETLLEFIEQVWNRQKVESVADFLDTAYTIHVDTGDPWEGKTLSREEFIRRLNHSFASFPDIHFSIQSAVEDGDFVAINWILTGTNLGPIGAYPPTGKQVRTTGATIYHFRNGKICGHSQVVDRTTVMKQLGYIV
ncbi:MAG TPA: ester cyclase [Bacteroidota bacterium]|nr:ester cyclase [Bacteroidota bacterium]